ncbi:uncharacterized protein LOC133799495 [Humulus lupulus]|uniref:uncharacterized protein LOC133799495 n=1 Tax=Humulus lupulus TaxID=3486 RepID=UPI002B415678|nr:uncharacterized protein LOC133799495 [Humulus lupulus]
MEQPIEYEWLPTKCSNCKKLGHSSSSCKFEAGTVWRKKESQSLPESDQQKVEEDVNSKHRSYVMNQKTPQAVAQDGAGSSDNGWANLKRTRNVKFVVQIACDQIRNSYSALQETQKTLPEQVGIGALIETKAKGDKIKDVMRSSFTDWMYYSSECLDGRILLIWKSHLAQVGIIQETSQMLHCRVRIYSRNQDFCLTVIYGSNSLESRRVFWTDLVHVQLPIQPWLVLGDFNAVFDINDRMGGRPISGKEMEDAQNWLALGLVEEMKVMVPYFSWSNNQDGGNRIYSKLDRILCNEAWVDLFPLASDFSHWEVVSDHSTLLIKQVEVQNLGIQPFHYFNMWSSHPQFREIVLGNWTKPICSGGGCFAKLAEKLIRLKHVLKRFNWRIMGDVGCHFEKKVKFYSSRAIMLCLLILEIPLWSRQKEKLIWIIEGKRNFFESFLRQNSKITWLHLGDDNTAYFHASLKKRKMTNHIVSYISDDGSVVDGYEKVTHHFLHHFQSFLGCAGRANGHIDMQSITCGPILDLDSQLDLIKPFTFHDVKVALFSIHPVKSPGPDGYGAGFFKDM